MSSAPRRGNKHPDKLFEALRKAQAQRDGTPLPPAPADTHFAAPGRHVGLVSALVAAAVACAAIAWAMGPD